MSAKWRRNLAWDDEFFPSWAGPAKFLLRLFSSIPLAVVLLSLVVVYATLASVPIGLLAQVPTYLILFASLVACTVLPGALVAWFVRRKMGPFMLAIAGGAVALVAGAVVWYLLVYPHLKYDWGTGAGFMLFAGFCDAYSGTTLRRLPVLEMSEVEFYSWWPLRIILLLFVVNMITATLRRIEFRFVNIGVLSVHSGIVCLALGSMYYGSMKREGDALLIAGTPTAEGHMTPGPPEDVYYDALRSALHVRTPGRNWAQLPLRGVPRYNDYNIEASVGGTLFAGLEEALRNHDDGGRTLDISTERVPGNPAMSDLKFQVVGYVAYADDRSATDFIEVDLASLRSIPRDFRANPVRVLELTLPYTNEQGELEARTTPLLFLPREPAGSLVQEEGLTVEYAMNRSAERTRDLLEPVPAGVMHALLIEADGHRQVYPLRSDYSSPTFNVFEPQNAPVSESVVVGDTGFAVDVLALLPEPPLQIVTPGYEGASSSMALLRVRKASDEGDDVLEADGEEQPEDELDNALIGPAPDPAPLSARPESSDSYTRWVYSRFPEISQDFLQDRTADGRPVRRDADPEIRVSYIDLTQIRLLLNENEQGEIDLIVRAPDGEITRFEKLGSHEGHANLIRVMQKWEHAEKFERPIAVPKHLQEADKIGTHERARLAVKVTSDRHDGWARIVWLPFSRYLDRSAHAAFDEGGSERWVRTPDGRAIELTFGRAWRQFQHFEMRLLDFQMVEYAHRGAPRDYQSTVEVSPRKPGAFEPFAHTAKLNAPLRAPYNIYETSSNPIVRFFRRLRSGLDPDQFKLSQAGWDPTTWEQTRAAVDRGELERPFVSHTILHVGNNPGIHVIAFGGILMAVGIPWAFYVKPWLLRRKKTKIQRQIRDGTYSPPKKPKSVGRTPEGASA